MQGLARAQELWIYMSCNDVVVVAELSARLTRFGESPLVCMFKCVNVVLLTLDLDHLSRVGGVLDRGLSYKCCLVNCQRRLACVVHAPFDFEVREGNVFSILRAFNHLEHRGVSPHG